MILNECKGEEKKKRGSYKSGRGLAQTSMLRQSKEGSEAHIKNTDILEFISTTQVTGKAAKQVFWFMRKKKEIIL